MSESGKQGRKKKRRVETGTAEAAQTFLKNLGRGENHTKVCTLCSLEHSFLSDQHSMVMEPSDQGREQSRLRVQRWKSRVLAAAIARKKAGSWRLASPPHLSRACLQAPRTGS